MMLYRPRVIDEQLSFLAQYEVYSQYQEAIQYVEEYIEELEKVINDFSTHVVDMEDLYNRKSGDCYCLEANIYNDIYRSLKAFIALELECDTDEDNAE